VADERERLPSSDEVRTGVPADFFDDLVASLDRAGQPNEELARAAERARCRVVQRSEACEDGGGQGGAAGSDRHPSAT
jgi:hypothetical protein